MTIPETPAQLFDLLHDMFGIGTYDEISAPQPPWFKVRMVEIGKLKKLLASRKATIADVALAADYARSQAVPVQSAWKVFSLIPEAVKADKLAKAEIKRGNARWEVLDAASEAINRGELDWAERLLRAAGADVFTVLAQWRDR